MSRLIDFYRGQQPDTEGRMLEQIWGWDDDELEHCHDFIQWMFPLDEPSAFNADAPLVSQEDRAAFRKEKQLQAAMRQSLAMFLRFLGLALEADGKVIRGENFQQKLSLWRYPNHNWLRISRVLKSLRLLGFDPEARALWACLSDLHEKDGFPFSGSFDYWKAAACISVGHFL